MAKHKTIVIRTGRVEFIRHDPSACMMPGLFRSFRSGEKRDKLDIAHDFGDGKRLEFSGPDQLGADDLRVLQGLVSLATKSHSIAPAPDGEHETHPARQQLALGDDACRMDTLVIEGSYADLAREIGHADVDETLTLRTCVERLCKVSVFAEIKTGGMRRRRLFRLVASYSSETCGQSGRLRVALNPQITEIMLGRCAQHARIEMVEVRALMSDPARLVHQRLCGWINPGKSASIALDTVCGYVWPTVTDSAMRMRRTRARKALRELEMIGWRAEEYERGKYRISRPGKAKVETDPLIIEQPAA